MGKRKRESSSTAFDMDEILGSYNFSTVDDTTEVNDSKTITTETDQTASSLDQKEGTNDKNDVTESWESRESLGGGADMDLFNRRDEELADMALFLARALRNALTNHTLREFVKFFQAREVKEVLLALKHIGAQKDFFIHLCSVSPASPLATLLLRYIQLLAQDANVESLSDPDVIRFLLFFFQEHKMEAPTQSSSSSSSATGRHWSRRRKRGESSTTLSGSPATPTGECHVTDDAITAAAVDKQCPSTASLSPFLTAVSILLEAILRQNNDIGLFKRDNSIVFQFTGLDGLSFVAKRLETGTPVPSTFFSLLEVLTVSDCLLETSPFFFPFGSAVVELYLGKKYPGGEKEKVALLRIMTNLTNIKADLFLRHASQLGEEFSSILKRETCSLEEYTFTVCCAINISLWELQNCKWEFTTHFLSETVLDRVVESMVRHYHRDGGTEKLVLSGYYSLLLAVLSLQAEEELNARVKVMTAVAKGTRDLEVRDKIRSKPMTYVAVILQEFIMFQGQIGTFTEKSFNEVSAVLAQLIKANDIHVTDN